MAESSQAPGRQNRGLSLRLPYQCRVPCPVILATRFLSSLSCSASVAGHHIFSLRATHRDLMALGAEKLASEATLNGSAAGEIRIGQIDILKLSAGSTFALFVVFTTPYGALAPRSRQAIQRHRQHQPNPFLRHR